MTTSRITTPADVLEELLTEMQACIEGDTPPTLEQVQRWWVALVLLLPEDWQGR